MFPSYDLKNRRRAVRAHSLWLSEKAFLLCQTLSQSPLRVLTIAELGLLVQLPEGVDIATLPTMSVLDAVLIIGKSDSFKFKIQPVYVRGGCMGIEFIDPSPEMRQQIALSFHAELTGATMTELNEFQESFVPKGDIARYVGQSGSILEVEIHGGTINRFLISYDRLQREVEWHRGMTSDLNLVEWERRALLKLVNNIDSLEPRIKKDLEKAILPASFPLPFV